MKLGGILDIYEKFQGVDPREVPMKIFPAVHYSMGGLWADYERTADGGLAAGSPRNQQTNLPGLFAIGECDYQYHGGNRLGANSLLSCIFSGLFVGPSVVSYMESLSAGAAADQPSSLFDTWRQRHQDSHDALLKRRTGNENPYLLHQELGHIMTKSATVVRHNDRLKMAIESVMQLRDRAKKCALSDTGNWTNQNVVFTKALLDMFPLALTVLRGALARDECRGAHFKPEFAMPGLDAEDAAGRRAQAEAWCDRFAENTSRWLKSTIAEYETASGDVALSYEPVDASIIPPRPRLYGLVGAEVIDEIWRQRLQQGSAATANQESAVETGAT